MTYFVSLKITAIIVGLLCLAGISRRRWRRKKSAPSCDAAAQLSLGVVLMLSATLWFTTLTG